ncbi:MAG TPA: MotA/TolQ/ExbB proton channel family protein [Tepidisphaeraceae bacterium]|jgi:biopolymer transport protein ExbB|nr:MotA/TolQ/ExbB proton channel family protein [Tepidisphaeraceae bacterium]
MKSPTPRIRFRLPPALFAVAAVFLVTASLLAADPPAAAPAAPNGSAAATDAKAEAPKLSAWQLYLAGGFFMYPLTLCSVLAIALIIERFISLRRSVVIPPSFLPGLRGVWRDPTGDREAAVNYCNQFDSAISRMVGAGIKRMPRGLIAAEKAVEDAGANEAIKLRRNMRFLYALGSVATLLGLIGTISGMIKAFQNAAGSAGQSPDVHGLTTGIYEAMVNTFGGLAVAIVVTIFYYYFVGRIERLITDMNDSLSSFSDEYGFNAESDVELRVTQTL